MSLQIDNASWLYTHIKSNKAVFAREVISKRVHLIALNRAARRVLESNKIKNLAKKNKAIIEDNTIS